MIENIAQLGSLAVISLFAVKEFFGYLKSKKDNGNGNGDNLNHAIFKELQTMNSNHLHSIEEAIQDGNREIVKSINDGNRQMIQLLGEIKGSLNK